ncbi:hypothetical protein [Streptomyces sp. NBC_01236]|uniref:hypothetical protein n=1 Tax=Streptomyces sp. NBC_01236 TaxID=2903789 RepID=UPI002E141EB3|nr:hypothetical protein OG324_08965 [Streptomyces sp. NBC_01236]
MALLLSLGLVVLGILLDRVWLWARAMDRVNYALFSVRDQQANAVSEISAHTRRAEEQMRRVAFRRRP